MFQFPNSPAAATLTEALQGVQWVPNGLLPRLPKHRRSTGTLEKAGELNRGSNVTREAMAVQLFLGIWIRIWNSPRE